VKNPKWSPIENLEVEETVEDEVEVEEAVEVEETQPPPNQKLYIDSRPH